MKTLSLLFFMRSCCALLTGVSLFFPLQADAYAIPFSLGLILLLGIPHGASDHHMFYSLADTYSAKASQHKKFFYFYYIGLMFLCGIVWFLFPVFSFVLFLMASAYHFGQLNIHSPEWNSGKINLITSFISGLFVLAVPLLAHASEAEPVVERLLHTELPIGTWQKQLSTAAVFCGLLYGAYLLLLGITAKAPGRVLIRESINWVLLFALFYTSPLWIGFSVYFAIWHALPSMRDQIAFFKQRDAAYSVKKYVRDIAPYSILSFLALLAGSFFLTENTVENGMTLLFAGISILTLPHVLLMDWLYSGQQASATEQGLGKLEVER
jgi:Brp/Blh family beta-carotene 15,15'-monooxygenase